MICAIYQYVHTTVLSLIFLICLFVCVFVFNLICVVINITYGNALLWSLLTKEEIFITSRTNNVNVKEKHAKPCNYRNIVYDIKPKLLQGK